MREEIIGDCRLILGDCRKYLFGSIEADSIDLTVTSPPYDKLRRYNNSSIWGWAEFAAVAAGLWRVTKPGGVVVWVVGDATVKGSETGTSFEHALFFKKCGFRLHDTMIYQKNSYPFPPSNRYYQQLEYMFVFSKGSPSAFNGIKQKTKWQKKTEETSTTRQRDGTTTTMKYEKGKPERLLDNIWPLNTGYLRTTKDKEAYGHPAIFPDELASRHIISWSNEGDMVLDPFAGSGTTGKMANLLGRKFIGCEIDEEYFEIALKRIEGAGETRPRLFDTIKPKPQKQQELF